VLHFVKFAIAKHINKQTGGIQESAQKDLGLWREELKSLDIIKSRKMKVSKETGENQPTLVWI
jgi:hypothetical protein